MFVKLIYDQLKQYTALNALTCTYTRTKNVFAIVAIAGLNYGLKCMHSIWHYDALWLVTEQFLEILAKVLNV